MDEFKALIGKVATGSPLTREEAASAFDVMMSGEATPSQMGALLMGLPWCLAAVAPAAAGLLGDPAHGGSPARALAWVGLAVPMALATSAAFRPRRAPHEPA